MSRSRQQCFLWKKTKYSFVFFLLSLTHESFVFVKATQVFFPLKSKISIWLDSRNIYKNVKTSILHNPVWQENLYQNQTGWCGILIMHCHIVTMGWENVMFLYFCIFWLAFLTLLKSLPIVSIIQKLVIKIFQWSYIKVFLSVIPWVHSDIMYFRGSWMALNTVGISFIGGYFDTSNGTSIAVKYLFSVYSPLGKMLTKYLELLLFSFRKFHFLFKQVWLPVQNILNTFLWYLDVLEYLLSWSKPRWL